MEQDGDSGTDRAEDGRGKMHSHSVRCTEDGTRDSKSMCHRRKRLFLWVKTGSSVCGSRTPATALGGAEGD